MRPPFRFRRPGASWLAFPCPSCLAAQLHIDYPMLFQVENRRDGRKTHCGVLEFIADEGMVYMPYWVSFASLPLRLLLPFPPVFLRHRSVGGLVVLTSVEHQLPGLHTCAGSLATNPPACLPAPCPPVCADDAEPAAARGRRGGPALSHPAQGLLCEAAAALH